MKGKAKRLLALVVCLIMLIALMASPISAASNKSKASASGRASSTITNVSGVTEVMTYAEYKAMTSNIAAGQGTIVIPALDYVVEGEAPTPIEDGYYYVVTTNEDGSKVSEKISVPTPIQGTVLGKEGALYVPETGSVSWEFEVPADGKYIIEITYCQAIPTKDSNGNLLENQRANTNAIERIFYINGEVPFSEARSIVLSKVWQYNYTEDGKFEQESNGNDVRPDVKPLREWTTYQIKDSNGYYPDAFEFKFSEGKNTLTLESVREAVVISSITLRPQSSVMSYEEYLAQYADKSNVSGNATYTVQAENPSKVSSVTMYPINDRTSPITQGLTGDQSAQSVKLNTFGKEQWQTVGEWAVYNIEAKEDGFYEIVVRYKQDLLSGMSVYRSLTIYNPVTGQYELPFAEAANCRFDFTDKWRTQALGDGNYSFKIYLTKGTHSIKLEAVLGEMAQTIQQVSNTLANINACYLEIIKLTGSNPDSNRTYNFSRVMPDVLETMIYEANNLEAIYDKLVANNEKGEQAAIIEQIYILLRKMGTNESQIPGNLSSLKSQIGSLGTWINTAKTQPLQLDYIQAQSPDNDMPQGEAKFFKKLWYEIKLFWYSFFTDGDTMGSSADGAHSSVEVWVTTGAATGRDEAQIIRNLSETFSYKNNISVNMKLVSGGTLLPSVLAGVGPDVSLMESSTTVIDYALRNAVLPLNEHMTGDDANVLEAFPPAASIPLTLYNYDIETDTTSKTYYALPDSLSFSMMFYRKDVLASLGIDAAEINTWDDLLSILPILQYNHMEIGIQNDIYTFIYQNGAKAYKDNGMRINFDDPTVLNAFTKLCNMYTQYSLPYTYDFSNRFRTGEMPIGISSYTTCNQLAIFATEISGLWGFRTLPGEYVKDDDGKKVDLDGDGEYDINNNALATVTGCIMLTGCEDPDAAWEFMKWYTSAEFQIPYANDIVSIKGIAARPATANKEALFELPWTNEEAQSIAAQFEHLDAVENHPGSYYLARYVNFAFLAAYNEDKDPANSLLDYTPIINKEITRKRQEFEMYTYDDYIAKYPNGKK